MIGITQLAGLAGLFRLNPYRAAPSVKYSHWKTGKERSNPYLWDLVWQVRQMAFLVSVCRGIQGFLGSGKSGKSPASPARVRQMTL